MPTGQICPLINCIGCWREWPMKQIKANQWLSKQTFPCLYYARDALQREGAAVELSSEGRATNRTETLIVIHWARRSTCWRPSIMNCANILIAWQTWLIYEHTCSLLAHLFQRRAALWLATCMHINYLILADNLGARNTPEQCKVMQIDLANNKLWWSAL